MWCGRMLKEISLANRVKNEKNTIWGQGGKEHPTYNKTKDG